MSFSGNINKVCLYISVYIFSAVKTWSLWKVGIYYITVFYKIFERIASTDLVSFLTGTPRWISVHCEISVSDGNSLLYLFFFSLYSLNKTIMWIWSCDSLCELCDGVLTEIHTFKLCCYNSAEAENMCRNMHLSENPRSFSG